MKDEEEQKIAEEANHRLVLRALNFEGSSTGEHGNITFELKKELVFFILIIRNWKN